MKTKNILKLCVAGLLLNLAILLPQISFGYEYLSKELATVLIVVYLSTFLGILILLASMGREDFNDKTNMKP